MAPILHNGNCRSFNGDGKLDLLCCNSNTGELFVFPHSGTFDGLRTFGAPVKISEDFAFENYIFCRAADITGTGRADVVGVRYPGVNAELHGFYYLENKAGLNGLDTLAEPVRFTGKRDDGREWETIGYADIAGNGLEETFSRAKDGENVDWWLHVGEVRSPDGTYDKDPLPLTSVDIADFPLAMADFTGSGKLDMLVLRANGDLDLLVFSPDFDFASSEPDHDLMTYTVARGWDAYTYFTLTDIDLDGVPDMLTRREDGALLAFRNRGKFDPGAPADLFEEPIVVGADFNQYDVIS
jgi:FG-GAP-like repeat